VSKSIDTKAEKRRSNYRKLVESIGETSELEPIKEILLNGVSYRKAAEKYNSTRSALHYAVDKLTYSAINPFEDRRKGRCKITQEIRAELKKILSQQPFHLPAITNEQNEEVYYAYYKWTNGLIQHYIQYYWGVEVSLRTCTKLLKELTCTHKKITDRVSTDNLGNMWIFLNFKVYERLVVTKKGKEIMMMFYACFAYNSDKCFIRISPKYSKYAKFIEVMLDEYIAGKATILFSESGNKQDVRDNNALEFCDQHEKIEYVVHSITPLKSICAEMDNYEKKGIVGNDLIDLCCT